MLPDIIRKITKKEFLIGGVWCVVLGVVISVMTGAVDYRLLSGDEAAALAAAQCKTVSVSLSFDRVTTASYLAVPSAPTRYYLHASSAGRPCTELRLEAQVQVCSLNGTDCTPWTTVSPWGNYRSDASGIMRIDIPTSLTADGIYWTKFRPLGASSKTPWSNVVQVAQGAATPGPPIDLTQYEIYRPGDEYIYTSTNEAVRHYYGARAGATASTTPVGRTILQMEQATNWCGYKVVPWRWTKDTSYAYWEPTGLHQQLRWMVAAPDFNYAAQPAFDQYMWAPGDKRYGFNDTDPTRGIDPSTFQEEWTYRNATPGPAYMLMPKSASLPYIYSGKNQYVGSADPSVCPPQDLTGGAGDISWVVRVEKDHVNITNPGGFTYNGEAVRVDYTEGAGLRESWYFVKNIGLVQILVKYFGGFHGLGNDPSITSPACQDTSDCLADTVAHPDVRMVLNQYFNNPPLTVAVSADNITYAPSIQITPGHGYYLKVTNIPYTGYLEARTDTGTILKWLWAENGMVHVTPDILAGIKAGDHEAQFRVWVANDTFPGETRVGTNTSPWSNMTNVEVLAAPTPTAALSVNGKSMSQGPLTYKVGDSLTFSWSSTSGVSATSNYTSDSPQCGNVGTGPFTWVANNLSDTLTATIPACEAGHTYHITYTVTGAGGQNVSSSLDIEVPK